MNNKIILFPTVKQSSVVKVNKVPVTVRALALALRINLNISTDSSLIYILGNGEASSNQHAIEIWLLENYNEHEIKSMSSPLEELANVLTTLLNNKLMSMEDELC